MGNLLDEFDGKTEFIRNGTLLKEVGPNIPYHKLEQVITQSVHRQDLDEAARASRAFRNFVSARRAIACAALIVGRAETGTAVDAKAAEGTFLKLLEVIRKAEGKAPCVLIAVLAGAALCGGVYGLAKSTQPLSPG